MKTISSRNLLVTLLASALFASTAQAAFFDQSSVAIAAIEAPGSTANLPRAQRSSKRKPKLRKPDVIYYPTPPETVTEMLRMAKIKEGDVLYDLGSGDGRIPISAARQYGIRATGIEIDAKLVTQAEENARQANVDHLVLFRNEDMFRVNYSEATVVTLYLSEKLNVLLRPKLLRELRPGSRILSHDFRMGDWKPEQTVRVPWGKLYRTVYLWTVPPHRKTHRTKSKQGPREPGQ